MLTPLMVAGAAHSQSHALYEQAPAQLPPVAEEARSMTPREAVVPPAAAASPVAAQPVAADVDVSDEDKAGPEE